MEIIALVALHISVLTVWAFDSRAIQYMRSPHMNLVRQLKRHEKMHRAHMLAMDMELAEIIAKELQQEIDAEKDQDPPSTALSNEALDILNKVSREITNPDKHKPAKKDDFWPTWDDYKNLDK
jgi:hypothetical protein